MSACAVLRYHRFHTLARLHAALGRAIRESRELGPLARSCNRGAAKLKGEFAARLEGVRQRANSPLAIRYTIGAVGIWDGNQDEAVLVRYFESAIDWIAKRHGGENVIAWMRAPTISRPYPDRLHVFVVPIINGALKSSHFIGRPQSRSVLHLDFGLDVGKAFGLVPSASFRWLLQAKTPIETESLRWLHDAIECLGRTRRSPGPNSAFEGFENEILARIRDPRELVHFAKAHGYPIPAKRGDALAIVAEEKMSAVLAKTSIHERAGEARAQGL